MTDPLRLLGFAFANADVLFEIDGEGRVTFATGAASELLRDKPEAFIGRPSKSLFLPAEGERFSNYTASLAEGSRGGPFSLRLVGGIAASVAMFRLPQMQDRIFCTLARTGTQTPSAVGGKDAKTGLSNRSGFIAALADMAAENDTLTLLRVPGLSDMCARIGDQESAKLLRNIGVAILDLKAKAAGRLADSSFGVIDGTLRSKAELSERVRKALAEGGVPSLPIEETLLSLKTQGLTADQRILAIRYVIEQFGTNGKTSDAPADVAIAFHQLMGDTQSRLQALTSTVADGTFDLAYQPIKDLKSLTPSHYEALARLPKIGETASTVKFAEALGVADAFDLAVAHKVLSQVETLPGETKIAFNLSGQTLSSPASFGLLSALLASKCALSPRVLIEITETAEIADLKQADQAVASLRQMGYRVGLDDFGAGAASLNYLHSLNVDFVKFDGALVKRIGSSKRDDTLLAGLLKLCRELSVQTVAECIETGDILEKAKALGFDLGQGRHLGEPSKTIAAPEARSPRILGKRKGVRESWG